MNEEDLHKYYEVLGVRRTATIGEIHQAYWRLASRYHPDKGGSHEQMVRLVEAWKILSDPVTRSRYDQLVKYRHDGWRSRQHTDDVRAARKRATDDAARTWTEFEAIYQKAFYTFNQDFYGVDLNEKAAGPYSPLMRPPKAVYRRPIVKCPLQAATPPLSGGMLCVFFIKVVVLLTATLAALMFYQHYLGIGQFVNLGPQGAASITVLDTTSGAVYAVEKRDGVPFYTWKKTVPPLPVKSK